jgi:hypothetical protein
MVGYRICSKELQHLFFATKNIQNKDNVGLAAAEITITILAYGYKH